MNRVASGSPTKQFFVGMLTRDINLNDAILDLLDNCLDGVVREKQLNSTAHINDNYYEGYKAEITITSDSFLIRDNCGGIPLTVAENYAFRMGRTPENDVNEKLPTVGVYGIGMKRAIFKLGKSAVVKTKNDEEAYQVKINETWTTEEKWDFPIEEIDKNELIENGTEILINQLNDNILEGWKNTGQLSNFVDELTQAIKESYSFIMRKGFTIILNGKKVDPIAFGFLVAEDIAKKESIKPYVFEKDYDGVLVKMIMGFYKPMQSIEDDEEVMEGKRTSAQAGWTITCNDRVVLYNDKTHITGWGESGVPSYHTQFIGICGVVMFESSDPSKLPMTTTKRGIDLSSAIYADVKNKMREALKMFTQYTNKWKGRVKEERSLSSKTVEVPIAEILENKKMYGINTRRIEKRKEESFKPDLPFPVIEKKIKYIRFSKPDEQINALRNFFNIKETDETIITASDIGEKCFDTVYEEYLEGAKKK
ncbi:ATP-binding protein [Enterococcus sp. AZ192]|uniref:ATP-binding protein n=1 Tax=unclassified Enterococcus TaxID=2608891 RepID=UPI003D2935E2